MSFKREENLKKLFPVILSGGSGDRLWPKSRKSLPKQFINFHKIGNLFTHTLKRVETLNNCQNLIIASSREYGYLIKKNLNQYVKASSIILEEISRNTSPAIYFAALKALEKSKDAILCIMPSDHWIEDNTNFKLVIKNAIIEAEKGFWVTLGIAPKNPSTGFGYIKTKKKNDTNVLNVLQFIEKPNLSTAEEFIQDKNYFWNAGIFVVSANQIVESFIKINPILEKSIKNAWLNRDVESNINIIKKRDMILLQNISIDKAILENEQCIKLVPFSGGWSDIGNWDSMNILLEKFNEDKKNQMLLDSKNTDIHSSDRLIVGIGLENITIVDEVDATLIFKKGYSEKVKSIVQNLKQENKAIAIEHTYEYRPWGKFEVLLDSKECKVKRLFIDTFKSLSYQYHLKRSEHWTVVSGEAKVILNGNPSTHSVGESIIIKSGDKHSLSNQKKDVLIIIEVQYGTYFGEDDIIRISDPYKR